MMTMQEIETATAEQLTAEDRRLLGTLCTRDEAGRHFIETHSPEWLERMEASCYITIDRPTHPTTGIEYGREYWSVGIMPNVPGVTDEHGFLIED